MTYIAIQMMKFCRIAYDIRLPKIRSDAGPGDGDGGCVDRADRCAEPSSASPGRLGLSSRPRTAKIAGRCIQAALAQRQSRGLIKKGGNGG